MNLSAFSSFLAIKPCWNHLTSNLGLLNVRCGAPFPRTRLSTNKRDYPGLLEKQIKRSADSSCHNCFDIKLNSAEILGAASLSSGPTSDPDPGEPRPGGKDGQLLLQVFGYTTSCKSNHLTCFSYKERTRLHEKVFRCQESKRKNLLTNNLVNTQLYHERSEKNTFEFDLFFLSFLKISSSGPVSLSLLKLAIEAAV